MARRPWRAAVGRQRGVLRGERAVGTWDPRPDVRDRERGMPQDERLVALRVTWRALRGARRRRFLVVAVVARGFVLVPVAAGEGIGPRRRRERVLDAGELPDTVALNVEQHRRPRNVECAR